MILLTLKDSLGRDFEIRWLLCYLTIQEAVPYLSYHYIIPTERQDIKQWNAAGSDFSCTAFNGRTIKCHRFFKTYIFLLRVRKLGTWAWKDHTSVKYTTRNREGDSHIILSTSSFSFKKTVHSLRNRANRNGTKNNIYTVSAGEL